MVDKNLQNEPEVTFREMDRFLNEKFPQRSCPDCKETSWTIPCKPPREPSTAATLFHLGGSPNGFPVFAAYCGNCGHVSSYSARVVLEWRNERSRLLEHPA